MARDQGAVRGPRAWPPSPPPRRRSPRQALELIEVEYEVLPHVIDVEAAMAPDAPMLHDDMFTAGVDAEADEALQHRQARRRSSKGDVEAGLRRGRVIVEGRYTTTAGASGLHRAARLPRDLWRRTARCTIWSSSQGHFMVRAYTRQAARHGHRQHPRDPGRNRRRLRRQDAGLSGAAWRSRCRASPAAR